MFEQEKKEYGKKESGRELIANAEVTIRAQNNNGINDCYPIVGNTSLFPSRLPCCHFEIRPLPEGEIGSALSHSQTSRKLLYRFLSRSAFAVASSE